MITRVLPGAISCDQCGTPALRVVGQTIVVQHIHHGQRHTTVLDVQTILDKIKAGC